MEPKVRAVSGTRYVNARFSGVVSSNLGAMASYLNERLCPILGVPKGYEFVADAPETKGRPLSSDCDQP